jgi:hypothetical protein
VVVGDVSNGVLRLTSRTHQMPPTKIGQPKEHEINETEANEVRKGFHASASGFDERRKHAVKVKDQNMRYEESAHHCSAMLTVRSSNYPADRQIHHHRSKNGRKQSRRPSKRSEYLLGR